VSGLAEEGCRGEAQHLVSIYGESVAARHVSAVTDLVQEGALADAIAAANAASTEYLNSEVYAAYKSHQASRNG
jgi:hypothetical protein